MAYLTNRTINRLNLHIALIGLFSQAYIIFTPIFLYKLGISIPMILAITAAVNVLRLPLRFAVMPLVRRWGLRVCVCAGSVGFAVAFTLLGRSQGVDIWLAGFLLAFSTASSLHWPCFHTLYTLAGEHEKRGRHVAVALACTTLIALLGPLLGAVFIVNANFHLYYMLAIPVAACSMILLSRCDNIPLHIEPWREGKKLILCLGARIQFAETWAFYITRYAWVLSIYLFAGDLIFLGGVATFSIAIQVLYQLLLGSWIDRGRGKIISTLACGFGFAHLIGKAILPLSFPMIVGMETLSAAHNVHHEIAQPVASYNAGKHTPHPYWYWFFTEAAWDVAAIIGLGGTIILLLSGVELRHTLLISLPPAFMLWWLLYRYFHQQHAKDIHD